MKTVLAFLVLMAMCLAGLTLAFAADCTVSWTANPSADGVASYQVYARPTGQSTWGSPRIITTKTSTTCRQFTSPIKYEGPWQFAATARDAAGNESVDFGAATNVITDLRVTDVTPGGVTVLATVPAGYKILIRIAKAPIGWGGLPDQPCQSTPCLITGLTKLTTYEVQAVLYTGVLGSATFELRHHHRHHHHHHRHRHHRRASR